MSNPEDYSQYASTQAEILQAVRENSVRRGVFFLNNLAALNIDGLIQNVEQLGADYDMEHWREIAEQAGIAPEALAVLDQHQPPVPYPYYFCLPQTLTEDPRFLLYYRNVAMVSNKVMNDIGLNTTQHEIGVPLDETKAQVIAQHLNKIVSALVLRTDWYGLRRHLELIYTNIGASLDGGWRNEVGRLAYVSIISPLVIHLHSLGKLESIDYRLKGRIAPEDLDDPPRAGKTYHKKLESLSREEVRQIIADLEEQRITYRQINLRNGNHVLLNRQITWRDQDGKKHRIGPDLITETDSQAYPWAAELKGGADPAGSDEHWKTASRAFDRIIEAANKTRRNPPRLSFIATILVDRVAREAVLRLQQGTLHSIHNLTKIVNDPTMQAQFMADMVRFFEMSDEPDETTT